MAERAFLGSGWRFPLQVDQRGAIARSSQEQRVEEAVYLILSTAIGERVMQPAFGCAIHDLVFAPNDAGTTSLAVDAVRRALVRWEPRIDVLDVRAHRRADTPTLLLIRVNYRVRATNTTGNLVYPFYVTEGA